MDPNDDYYAVLGVSSTASAKELKRRFRFLSHAFHPDKFPTPDQRKTAEEEFKRINQAYQTLSDPALRARFDWQRTQPAQTPRPSPSAEGASHKWQADYRPAPPPRPNSRAERILKTAALVVFFSGIGLSAVGVITGTSGLNGIGALICLAGWLLRICCRWAS